MSSLLRRIGYFIATLLTLWLLLGLWGSCISTRPKLVDIPPAESLFGKSQRAEEVMFKAGDGQEISAWYLPRENARANVILLNGIGGNRLGMVARAKIYLGMGFNVLLPDLRGTGESKGLITFGWQERLDLLAAVDFLKARGAEYIGVHGCSLGAATITYTFSEAPAYQFVVLESPYDNIEQALHNRVDLFHLPLWLFEPLIWWTEWRLDVAAEQLSPEICIKTSTAPTLLLAGDSERKVKKTETEQIFQNCAATDKQLHFFKGGRHEDFNRRFGKEYKQVLSKWLERIK